MAHFIQGTKPMLSRCILKAPTKQIILPKRKDLIRLSGDEHANRQSMNSNSQKSEHILITKMCEQLGRKQLDQIRCEYQENIHDQFICLKRSMRKTALAKKSQVERYFDGKQNRSLNKIRRLQTNRKVDLCKQYQIKILNKVVCLKEAREICHEKEHYRKWLDKERNSPVKSPIYRKMNFMLEKIAKLEESELRDRTVRNTDPPIDVAQPNYCSLKGMKKKRIGYRVKLGNSKIGHSLSG